jgi:Macrocin-O-methyltransferase (TylF)
MAGEKFPQRKIVILHDGAAPIEPCAMVDCRSTPVDHFSVLDFANLIFVYACSWSFHGAPFIKTLIARGGRFIPVWNAGPASYVDQNAVARDVLEAEWARQNQEGYAKWDPGPSGPADFTNLWQALEITRHKKGVFLEIGCYRGSSGSIALRYMNQAGIYRDAYCFDVFEGFLYDAALASADAVWSGSHATEGIGAVARRLQRYALPRSVLNVIVRRHNIIEQEIPADVPLIAVANIDVDLYEAVLAALHKTAPRMTSGGIIIVEDPGHTPYLVGARVALDEFLGSRTAAGFLPIYMESGQTFLVNMNPG